MSERLDEAREMVRVARETGRIYAVIQNRRYMSHIRTVAGFLRSGAIGDVEEVHCDFFLGPRFGGFREEMDFPLLVDMAIHTFDQARFITGADATHVYCHSFNPPRSWNKGDTSAIAIFEMETADGKPLTFCYRGSWCAEGCATLWESDWRIVGHRGTVRWDGGADIKAERVAGERPQGKMMRPMEPVAVEPVSLAHTGHDGLLRDFVEAVRTGKPPLTHCEDNIKSLAMVLAAVESAKSKTRVEVARGF